MEPCASSDSELGEDFIRACMGPDLAFWHDKLLREGYLNRSHIDALIDRYRATAFPLQSFVLIKSGKWYYPFIKDWDFSPAAPGPLGKEVPGPKYITPWVTTVQWYFEHLGADLDFPDTFFFISDQDLGWCGSDHSRCPIPALSITRKISDPTIDLLFPFMVGMELPLYNYPWQLKNHRAFFSGRPNWGASPRTFRAPPNCTNTTFTTSVADSAGANAAAATMAAAFNTSAPNNATAAANATNPSNGSNCTEPPMVSYWSREHMARLSYQHPDKLYAALMVNEQDAKRFPNATLRGGGDEVSLKDHARWRYLMHLDGTSYSYRLSRIMHANSVILKEETVWPEYFVRAMKPGVHYLPIFKDGPDDVLQVLEQWGNRTRELKRIAWNSQQFAVKYLCPRARVLYFRRLLKEYTALFGPPRNNAMQAFIDDVMWPLIQKKMAGDVKATYLNITAWDGYNHMSG